jgi:hypothetical protein
MNSPEPKGPHCRRADALINVGIATFGVADRTLRFRMQSDAFLSSKMPLLGRIRLEEAWERIPRARGQPITTARKAAPHGGR